MIVCARVRQAHPHRLTSSLRSDGSARCASLPPQRGEVLDKWDAKTMSARIKETYVEGGRARA